MWPMPSSLVHHLYVRAGDLLPYCGVSPARDHITGDFHTGRSRDDLLLCVEEGLAVCTTCLSPQALGGFTPLIMDEEQ